MSTSRINHRSTAGRGATAWLVAIALVMASFFFALHLPTAWASSADCAMAATDMDGAGGSCQTSNVPDCANHAGCSMSVAVVGHSVVAAQVATTARPMTRPRLASHASRPPAPPPDSV